MTLETPRSQTWSDLCLDAARTTTECADWCIQNNHDEQCIRFCLDAGNLAATTGRLVSRESPYVATVLRATADVLERCAGSCEDHRSENDVFGRCIDDCRAAAEACRTVAERQT